MAELTIRPDEIRDALADFVRAYEPDEASRQEVGTVAECGDGIARVEGLPSAMANELLEFPGGIRGLALNLDIREIGVVILGDFSKVEEGQQVRRSGEVLSVPVGDGFLGRVVDPLGIPMDGKGEVESTELRALELQAPTVVQRTKVSQPLPTIRASVLPGVPPLPLGPLPQPSAVRPSPSANQGSLAVSPGDLDIGTGSQGQLVITAEGAAETWQASPSSGQVGLSAYGGTLQAGQSVTLTVSISRAGNSSGSAVLYVEQGSATAQEVQVTWSVTSRVLPSVK